MRKLGGLLLIAALALTACSTSTEELAPGALIDDGPSPTQSTAAGITAAPIEPQAVATTSAKPVDAAGGYGDPAIDGPFLETVKGKWIGAAPEDTDLVSAAKFACEALADGATYETTGAVQYVEGNRDGELNNAMLSAYASLSYCEDLAY